MGDPLGVAHPFSSFLILFILKFTKMTHLQIPYVSPIGHDKAYNSDNSTITYTSMRLPLLLLGGWLMFLVAGPLLQSIDPRSAVLDIGILTILLFGLLLGFILHRFVILTMEIDTMMFGRDILPLSFVYAMVLTMGFSVLVNITMNKKLQQIDMAASLKSVE